MTIKKTGKYAPQETYAGKMKDKDCVRITVWIHKDKAAKFKTNARKNCVPHLQQSE
jgi:hypothetical protein